MCRYAQTNNKPWRLMYTAQTLVEKQGHWENNDYALKIQYIDCFKQYYAFIMAQII